MRISRDDLRQDVETYLKKGGKINQVPTGQSSQKHKNTKATARDIRNMEVIATTSKSFSGDRIRCAERKNNLN